MTNLATFRVHIAPLGFEIDRIIIPLKQTKADKLWLLSHDNRSSDLSAPYLEKIKKECKKLGVEVKIAYADRLNLFKAIKSIKDIIEQEKGNYIYVNVASGSKIQAIACMMACMILKENNNLQPFYAEPEKYAAFEGKQQSFGIKDTIPLPTYEIQIPKPTLVAATIQELIFGEVFETTYDPPLRNQLKVGRAVFVPREFARVGHHLVIGLDLPAIEPAAAPDDSLVATSSVDR